MIHFTDVTGLLGCSLAIVVLVSKLPGVARLARVHRAWAVIAAFMLALLPAGGLPLAGYVRGATGDLSMASLLLLSLALLRFLRDTPMASDRSWLLLLLVLAAAGFYPLALGWGGFDPYRLGYGGYGFLACLLGIALLAWWRGMPTLALAIVLAVGAWSAGWYESTNLWDYLIDPLVSLYAAFALALTGLRRLKRKRA